MKRKIFVLVLAMSSFYLAKAQIGINTQNPDKSSILDIIHDSKGILIPRLTTTQKEAISNPAFSLLVYDTSLSCYSQYNGTKWKCLNMPDQIRWFYMPSIAIKTDQLTAAGAKESINLYDQYKAQFMGTDATTSFHNASAPQEIPYFPKPEDLHYYITYYSKDVFQIVSLSDVGQLEYRIIGNATDETHMNVVFVIK